MINLPTISEAFQVGPWTDPVDWAYFCTVSGSDWKRAKLLAKKYTELLADTKYSEFIRSCGPVERAGESILQKFFDYYCELKNSAELNLSDPYRPAFTVCGKTIDVHTRMLKFRRQANAFGPMGTCLNVDKFLVMVPELGLIRSADIYAFCGFDIDSKDGFFFGWTTAERLAAVPLSVKSKHKSKCLMLTDLYPAGELITYITS